MSQVTESLYPITFRSQDAKTLGTHLRQHNSVVLIGMKRVGISNFLRFFLHHPDVESTYIQNGKSLRIVIDLNNLVEKTTYEFWMLTLKRIVDAIDQSDFPRDLIEESSVIFTQCIQLGNPFFTLESVHKLLSRMSAQDHFVTLFFVRFDRMKEVITNEFFANIRGLQDTGNHLSYVFTSFRPLYEIAPKVFIRSALSGFCEEMYLQPAKEKDMQIILSTFLERYGQKLRPKSIQAVLKLAGGHVQFLHLILIKLKNENIPNRVVEHEDELTLLLSKDEEIKYLCEELLASLTESERDVLSRLISEPDAVTKQLQGKYLWDTGMIRSQKKNELFSPLLRQNILELQKTKHASTHDFTKKEYALFSLLRSHENALVERDAIILAVWPDEVEYGVSDWSIDRLVSRVRHKLKLQHSLFRIETVITRGYKLVS